MMRCSMTSPLSPALWDHLGVCRRCWGRRRQGCILVTPHHHTRMWRGGDRYSGCLADLDPFPNPGGMTSRICSSSSCGRETGVTLHRPTVPQPNGHTAAVTGPSSATPNYPTSSTLPTTTPATSNSGCSDHGRTPYASSP